MQGATHPIQAVPHAAREVGVEQQELDDPVGADSAVALAVHFERAGAAEYRGPVDVVEAGGVGARPGRDVVLYVEDAGGLIGPLDESAEFDEVPRLVAGHGCAGDSAEKVAGLFDLSVEGLRRLLADGALGRLVLKAQVEAIELLPHLRRDDLADGAGVLAGRAEAGEDGVAVAGVEAQEPDGVL